MKPLRSLAYALTHLNRLPGCPDTFGDISNTFAFALDRTHGFTVAPTPLFGRTAHQTLVYRRDEAFLTKALLPLMGILQEADILWAVDPQGGQPTYTAPHMEIMWTTYGLHHAFIHGISEGAFIQNDFFIHHRFEMARSGDTYPCWRVERWLQSFLRLKPPFALYPAFGNRDKAFAPAGLNEAPWGNNTPYKLKL